MPFFERLQHIEKKFAVGFLGFIMGLPLAYITIYTAFFQKKAPNLRFQIVSSASVFDVKEDVGKLDVLFNGVNIREKKQMLTLLTFTVSNTGTESITKNSYDEKEPFGFSVSAFEDPQPAYSTSPPKVTAPEIIKAELLPDASDYIKKHLEITNKTNSAIFTPVILDDGDSFSVKVLVLHHEGLTPFLKPTGKLAGVKKIELVPLRTKPTEASPWEHVREGNPTVHMFRFVVYVLAFLALCLTFVLLAILFDKIGKRKRLKVTLSFRHGRSIPSECEFVLSAYISHGYPAISEVQTILKYPNLDLNHYDRHSDYELARRLKFSMQRNNVFNELSMGNWVARSRFVDFVKEFNAFIGTSTLFLHKPFHAPFTNHKIEFD